MAKQQLVLADKPQDSIGQLVQRMAGELIASTALSRMEGQVNLMSSRMDKIEANGDKLNHAFGEFKDKEIAPLRRELEHFRYNTGARTEEASTNIEVLLYKISKALDRLGVGDDFTASIKHGRFEDIKGKVQADAS